MIEVTVGTPITVDAGGQPRVRSILVSKIGTDLKLWMGTRKGSRELEQLSGHPRATRRIFADDSQITYLSLMGEARVVSDPESIALNNPFPGEALTKDFPMFPNDFVLSSFKPRYLKIAEGSWVGLDTQILS